jgi:phosphoribosylformylglycinamidine synthase
MLGLMEDPSNHMTLNFKNEGDIIYLVGKAKNDISSSEYLYSFLGIKASPAPAFDLDEEARIQETIKSLIKAKLINSAHDISEGGIFVTLAESAMAGNLGFEVQSDPSLRKDAWLFGEGQSRVVVTVNPAKNTDLVNALTKAGVSFSEIGRVTKNAFAVDKEVYMQTAEAKDKYDNTLGNILG